MYHIYFEIFMFGVLNDSIVLITQCTVATV